MADEDEFVYSDDDAEPPSPARAGRGA